MELSEKKLKTRDYVVIASLCSVSSSALAI